MAGKSISDAREYLRLLKHVDEHLGLPSVEGLGYWTELQKVYGRAKPEDQAVIVHFVSEGNEIWDRLKAKQAEKRNSENGKAEIPAVESQSTSHDAAQCEQQPEQPATEKLVVGIKPSGV